MEGYQFGLHLQRPLFRSWYGQLHLARYTHRAEGEEAISDKLGIDIAPYQRNAYALTQLNLSRQQWLGGIGLAYRHLEIGNLGFQSNLVVYFNLSHREHLALTQTEYAYPQRMIAESFALPTKPFGLAAISLGFQADYTINRRLGIQFHNQAWARKQHQFFPKLVLGLGLHYSL